MGKSRKNVKPAESASEQSLTWRIVDPGMDLFERAGLAGLYMALRAARESCVDLSPLTWHGDDLKPDSVTVRWKGAPKPAFVRLMEWAWQVREGVLYLPAVHDAKDVAMIQNRVTTHNGIMRTFLQHPNAQPKGESIHQLINLDEQREIEIRYQPPIIRPPKRKAEGDDDCEPTKLLRPWSDVEALFASDGTFKPQAGLSGWAFPGVGGRYGQERKGKAWKGPAVSAIALMLTPTICLYLRLPRTEARIKEKRVWIENWATVVPDVRDLHDFAERRPRVALSPDYADVASLGDAAMRFLAEYSTAKPRQSLHAACLVLAMGKVSYYPNQSVRKAIIYVSAEERSVKRYRILQREMPHAYVWFNTKPVSETAETKAKRRKNKSDQLKEATNDDAPRAAGFMRLPSVRGRIVDNLVLGRPWYIDLSVPMIWNLEEAERERKKVGKPVVPAWFQAVCYQRSKLMRLIAEDDMWDTEAEKVFVQAFWETLDSLYAQEADAARRGGSASVEKRWERLEGELYRSITQAKARAPFRSAVSRWFAKAGRQKSIGAHSAAVWRLIDQEWSKGRDLALLALASHRNKETRESVTTTEQGA